MTYRGLTWDHPRGRDALVAAQRFRGAPACPIAWDVQPLEGFESAPIARTAEAYDLVVLDHPHLGEAVADGALRPLDTLVDAETLDRWRASTVGASFASYELDGRSWAVPLDAATQVSVTSDPGIPLPATWDEARELAREVETVLPSGGPHLFLTLCAIAVGDGERPGAGEVFLPDDVVARALELLRALAPSTPWEDSGNPIAVLEAMSSGRGPRYCPHIYGYVNYAAADRERPLVFGDAPSGRASRGSVLGGTGIAVSARCEPDDALRDHLSWLMEPRTQSVFVPANAGQPARTEAWDDAVLDAAFGGFYRRTRRTVEEAWVRPRHAGAIAFQSAAADAVRSALWGGREPSGLARRLTDLYNASLDGGTTATSRANDLEGASS